MPPWPIRRQGTPLVVFGGEQYGAGSSRDWAAKGTNLLGVKAVIAESFERIHRSNLVGMGVIPFEFTGGDTRKTLGLTGEESVSIKGLDSIEPQQEVPCEITYADGTKRRSRSSAGSIPRSRSSISNMAACCITCALPMPFAAGRRAPSRKACARWIAARRIPDLFDAEHMAYVAALRDAGLMVTLLEPLEDFPDSCFIEDPALCLKGVAIVLRPGAPTRAGEAAALKPVLSGIFAEVRDLPGEGRSMAAISCVRTTR